MKKQQKTYYYDRCSPKNRRLVDWLLPWLEQEQPATVRQCFYQAVVAGHLKNTPALYQHMIQVLTRLRDDEIVPLDWLVDHGRRKVHRASWPDLASFREAVIDSWRLDFWEHLYGHVCVLVEKDTVFGVIAETCDQLRVPIWVSRGYCSLSFCHEIATDWARLDRPVHVLYIGDHDPSGVNIEESYQERLTKYAGNLPDWERLAITRADLDRDDIVRIPVNEKDRRTPKYKERFGISDGTEVEALEPHELRDRVREAVEQHIDRDVWQELEEREDYERKVIRKRTWRLGK